MSAMFYYASLMLACYSTGFTKPFLKEHIDKTIFEWAHPKPEMLNFFEFFCKITF